jgi:ABC-2 type transport system permease protein
MLRSIYAFEVRYHLRNPFFYIVFFTFGLLCFAAVTSEAVQVGGAIGNVHRNAPVVIFQLLGVMSVIGVFFNTAFVASSAQRDFETATAELFFSKPMKKVDYLLGRFLGSITVSMLVYLGPALGILIGTKMPWLEPERVGPFMAAPYLFALLAIVLPNLIMTGGVFFSLAAWSRSLLFTYLGVVVFFVLFQVAGVMLADVENLEMASLADPFGLASTNIATRYWTIAEQNTAIPALAGPLLWNRLLWVGVGLAVLALGIWRFRFERSGSRGFFKKKKTLTETADAVAAPRKAESFQPRRGTFGAATTWRQFLRATRLEVGLIFRSAPFLVIVAFGAFNVFGGAMFTNELFGTSVYPVTHLMLEAIAGSFLALLAVILTFYAGELVFRERTAGLADVNDATPTPNGVFVASKLTALMLIAATALLVAALTTMFFQATHGYTNFEPGLYVKGLLIAGYPFLIIASLAFFLQVLINHKFLGYMVMILYMLSGAVMRALDLDHHLYRIAARPDAPYSDMNGYGHFLQGVFAYGVYHAFMAALMISIALVFWVRGRDSGWRFRRALAASRLRGGRGLALALSLLGFVGTGAYIFYNTNVLNTYRAGDEQRALQASYEKKFRQYKDLVLPRVTAAKLDVDIYPETRRMEARGVFTLKNKSAEPQKVLHYQLDPNVEVKKFELPAHKETLADKDSGYHILEFEKPIPPGESFDLRFEVAYGQKGFVNDLAETRLVENGTFFNSGDFFPAFGYNDRLELQDRNDRRKNDLPPVHRWPEADDLFARRNNYISPDADWIDFETTVSTSADQIAIAPGYLQKEWQEGGRRYFHYKMDSPIFNFYAYLSARYAVKKDSYEGVAIEIFYDPKHEYNVGRMVDSIKKSLEYFGREFGPYQHRQMRILEFPLYARFAQSFPNTVPFSESIGFIAKLDGDEEAIDYVFYVTAHEVAHQWWAHQVIGGPVKGATMLSETFSQYSALMVMEKEYGKEKMRRFLKFELDRYLQDRGGELVEEMPLAKVENQPYIHYRKGSLILYALRDYLGEETVNRALRKFRDATAFQEPPYTTSMEFLDFLRAETPAEYQPLIDDLFLRITLLENKVESVTYAKNADGTYKVRIEADVKKLYSTGQGEETEAPLDQMLDVGVFGEEEKDGKKVEKVLFLEKRRIQSGKVVVEVNVAELPKKAGIDPYNKWVDRNSNDNVKSAEEAGS